nr:DUF1194 domain-containing protein [Microvirga makkahensis]
MDPAEQELQRSGFAEAFRSTEVQDAIRSGMLGRIAVTYVEWGSSYDQKVLVPWTVRDGTETTCTLRRPSTRCPFVVACAARSRLRWTGPSACSMRAA